MVDYEDKGLFCHKCGRRNFGGNAISLSNHVRVCQGIKDVPKLGSSVRQTTDGSKAYKAQKRAMERMETALHEDGTARISFLKKRRKTGIPSENPAQDDYSDDSDSEPADDDADDKILQDAILMILLIFTFEVKRMVNVTVLRIQIVARTVKVKNKTTSNPHQ